MKKTFITVFVVASAAFSSANIYAADAMGGYAGVSIGQSDSGALNRSAAPGVSIDDNDIGYKFFAGYNFNANFAVEGFYADLGETSATNGVQTVTAAVDTIGLTLLAKLPVSEEAEVFVKLGYQHWDAKGTSDGATVIMAEEEGSEAMYGVGATYTFENLAIRAEYENYGILLDEEVSLLSVGLIYNF